MGRLSLCLVEDYNDDVDANDITANLLSNDDDDSHVRVRLDVPLRDC